MLEPLGSAAIVWSMSDRQTPASGEKVMRKAMIISGAWVMLLIAYFASYFTSSQVVFLNPSPWGYPVTVRLLGEPWQEMYRPLAWVETHARHNFVVGFHESVFHESVMVEPDSN